MRKIFVLIGLFVFILIGFLSIGYSAFSTNLAISGDAILRRNSDVRITNLELIDKQNDAFEKYNSEFSKNLTSMFVSLPNTNSSVTYRVTVTNKTSSYFTPGEIEAVINSNSNVNYVIEGIESFGVYQGSNCTFLIKINTTSANQELNISIKYDFKVINESSWDYTCTGNSQNFEALYKANYKIELWGAGGGGVSVSNGGYVSGSIGLNKGKILYVYVGGTGVNFGTDTPVSGYNGGGNAVAHSTNFAHGSTGGGATDVRIINGNWDNFDSLKTRIMVAGGGGGGADGYYDNAGFKAGMAGGLEGYTALDSSYPMYQGNGGTQTSGGILPTMHSCSPNGGTTVGGFGYGGNGGKNGNNVTTGGGSGGGGGYYGGSGSSGLCNGTWAGGGGSSFISGHDGCNAINPNSTLNNIVHTGNSIYDGYKFVNTVMIDGKGCKWTNVLTSDCSGQVQPDGSTGTGHTGNGYARITLIPSN